VRVRRWIVAVAVLAAACAGDDPEPTDPGAQPDAAAPAEEEADGDAEAAADGDAAGQLDEDEPADGNGDDRGEIVEHDAPQPRLVVADVDSATVVVVDLSTGDTLAELELRDHVHGHGAAMTQNGRFLLAPHDDGVSIVDAGAWSTAHGSHAHHYTTTPALLGEVDGPDPSHLVSGGGLSALFFDGDGSTTVLDETQLDDGQVHVVTTIETGEAHHGFTVPAGDHGYVVTVPTDDMEAMPNVVGGAQHSGEVTATFDCVDTHGETGLPDGAAAACQDGVLLVAHDGEEWTGTLLPYPAVDDEDPYGFGDARAWVLSAPSGTDHLVAPLGAEHVLLVDRASADARALPVGHDVALFGVDADDDGRILVLTTDGSLQALDPDDGTTLDEVQVVDAFAEGDPESPYRRLLVSGRHAYVSDPDGRAVVEVALDDLTVTRTIDVRAVPGFLGLAGG
jgi:outer membrane protein assembly factor BamB